MSVCVVPNLSHATREGERSHAFKPDSAEDTDQRWQNYCKKFGIPDPRACVAVLQLLEQSNILTEQEMDFVKCGLTAPNCRWLVSQLSAARLLEPDFSKYVSRPRKKDVHSDILLKQWDKVLQLLCHPHIRRQFVDRCRAGGAKRTSQGQPSPSPARKGRRKNRSVRDPRVWQQASAEFQGVQAPPLELPRSVDNPSTPGESTDDLLEFPSQLDDIEGILDPFSWIEGGEFFFF